MTEPTVRDAGEFGLIAALAKALPADVTRGSGLRIGIGDDAAVWSPPSGEDLVVTTDSMVEGVHFRLDWTDWASLGHKLLASNLSDIASMGASPTLAVVTVGVRGDESLADVTDLYRGMGALAQRWQTLIAGGDIVASPSAVTLHLTLIGSVAPGRALLRSGARPGDVIGVTGTLGASAAGLEILRTGRHRDAATADLLVAAHLRPQPRLDVAPVLSAHGVTAAMDISDGLFGDLPKILAASEVAAVVDLAAIPVPASVRALFPDGWQEMATRGGEDYELLFTAPPERFSAIRQAAADVGGTVTAIGTIRAGSPELSLRNPDGTERVVAAGAFDHFQPAKSSSKNGS